jgi:hypothetical protein
MDYTVLIIILLVSAATLAVNAAIFFMFRRKLSALQRNYHEFVTPEHAGEKSGLDEFVDRLSYNIGHSAFTQVRSMMASSESASVRGQKAVDSAISEDLLSSVNPLLAGLLDTMPALRKVVRRNPALADYALEKITSKVQTQQSVNPTIGHRDNGNYQTTLSI